MANFLRDCNGPGGEDKQVYSNFQRQAIAPAALIVTAGAATYVAEELLRGLVIRDPSGAARSDVMPTAALLVAAVRDKFGDAEVGDVVSFCLVNCSDGAGTEAYTYY